MQVCEENGHTYKTPQISVSEKNKHTVKTFHISSVHDENGKSSTRI